MKTKRCKTAREATTATTINAPSTTIAPLGEATFGLTSQTLRPGLTRLLVSCQLVRKANVKRFPRFYSASSVYQNFKAMTELDREHFVVLGLDCHNRCIALYVASVGTLTETLVSPREIFRMAILSACTSIVGLHNHPSGSPHLSPQDIEVGKRLARVGDEVGIKFIDHIVVSVDGYESMNEKGLLG